MWITWTGSQPMLSKNSNTDWNLNLIQIQTEFETFDSIQRLR
jgi:hypothetical protein